MNTIYLQGLGYNHIKLEQFWDSLLYLTKAVEVLDVYVGDDYDLSECYFYLDNARKELGEIDNTWKCLTIALGLGRNEAGEMIEKNYQ